MIPITKMQGIGNDFVMLDALAISELPQDLPSFARKVTNRRLGVGGDGLILVERGTDAPYRMRMFNPDGSESEMCGNGLRCFGRLLKDAGYVTSSNVAVETGAGILDLTFLTNGNIAIDVGIARFKRGEIGMAGQSDETFIEQPLPGGFNGSAIGMGNPHLVIFTDDVQGIELTEWGPRLENDPLFPHRINVHFVQVVDSKHLIQRTWERGAGITLACGTGACSCGVAAFVTGRAEREVEIQLPGGILNIHYQESGHVIMTGPAETVFVGTY